MTDLRKLAQAVRDSFTPLRGGAVEALLTAVDGHECVDPTPESEYRIANTQLLHRLAERVSERNAARAERDAMRETVALGGVTVVTDMPAAAGAELQRLANEARDVANRNAQIAAAAQSQMRDARAERDAAQAERDEARAHLEAEAEHRRFAVESTRRAEAVVAELRAENQRLRGQKTRLRTALKRLTDACVPAGNMVEWPSYSEARAAFKETE